MEKPRHYLIFKILSAVFFVVTITGIVFVVKGFGDFETNFFMVGGIMFAFGLVGTFACALIGFRPEFTKLAMKSAQYIQQETKAEMMDIVRTGAEIQKGAVTMTAAAVKEGLTETKFCKHCGAKIDEDSKFCKKCGGAQ